MLDCDVTMTSFNSFNVYGPLIISKDSLQNYLHGLPVILTDCRTGALLPWCYGCVCYSLVNP